MSGLQDLNVVPVDAGDPSRTQRLKASLFATEAASEQQNRVYAPLAQFALTGREHLGDPVIA